MRVGFTGTRKMLTISAIEALGDLIERLEPTEAHHGDCVGADSIFHAIAFRDTRAHVYVHPPDNPSMRSYCGGRNRVTVLPARPYLERNRDIVDACEILIAAPETAQEKLRGGTWSTVRYARQIGRKIYLVLPDGTVTEEARNDR